MQNTLANALSEYISKHIAALRDKARNAWRWLALLTMRKRRGGPPLKFLAGRRDFARDLQKRQR